MTFAELLASNDPGIGWLIEVSFNDFATVAYRWGTSSYQDSSGNNYDGRIASLTAISRGFGNDHLPAPATVKVTLDNSDFGTDWLIDRTTVATQVLQARFRLSAILYDRTSYAGAAALTSATQTFCIFTCMDQPELADNLVTLVLSDDSLGRLAEPLTTPTVRDWFNAASLIGYTLGSPDARMDWDVPLPLVFGLGEWGVQVPAYLAIDDYAQFPTVQVHGDGFPKTSGDGKTFPLVVCASRAGNFLQVTGEAEITQLSLTYRDNIEGQKEMRGVTVEVPRSYTFKTAIDKETIEIWTPRRSVELYKDGCAWQVVYIDFNVDLYVTWYIRQFYFNGEFQSSTGGASVPSGWVPTTTGASTDITKRGYILGAIAAFHCNGTPLSVVTQRAAPPEGVLGPSRLLIDFAHDAIAYYSKATTADMDTAAWERAAKARASVLGAGIVQPARPAPDIGTQRYGWVSPSPQDGIIGVLRTALGEMAGSCDADLFMTREGLYSVSTNVFDFTAVTGARVDVDETRITGVKVRTPSTGERWAPYNRVMLTGPGGVPFGPYDNQAAITAWGRVMPVQLQAKWNQRLTYGGPADVSSSTVWNFRTLEARVRPVITFVASREYVALELGDYFTFTWSRGGLSSVFAGTLFRVESLKVDPTSLAVEVGAVWADDLVTEPPFLLDDERFLVRVSNATYGAATVTDGSASVSFAGGDLFSDGIRAGDILVLKDSTQADDVFTRYRALRIAGIDDVNLLHVAETDLDFGAPLGANVATWEIRSGATTYPTSSSDPVNYPSGGTMYGKACNIIDEYSDASAANQLKDG